MHDSLILTSVQIPTQLLAWPTNGLRRASINSFGYGGTNAHCIVDDAYHYLKARGLRGAHSTVIAPEEFLRSSAVTKKVKFIDDKLDTNVSVAEVSITSPTNSIHGSETSEATRRSDSSETGASSPIEVAAPGNLKDATSAKLSTDTVNGASNMPYTSPRLLLWSSHEQKGTERRAAALLSYVNDHTSTNSTPADNLHLIDKLAFTLSNKRSRFQWRSFAVVSDLESAKSALSKPRKPVRALENPVLSFIFTGQGAQWFAMGRELNVYRVYRESIEAAGTYMTGLGAEWDLVTELGKDEKQSRVGEAVISQPACTAVQVAIVDLLDQWGVKPTVVAGHSSGEVAVSWTASPFLLAYHTDIHIIGCIFQRRHHP